MTSRATDIVRVEGLADFQRELRKLNADLPKELRKANIEAAEVVAKDARQRAEGRGGVAAKSAPSIKAQGEQRRSKITIGGPKFPFALGAEFGAVEYPQFDPWTGSGSDAGYFFYPAIRDTREEFMDVYEDALDRLARRAFPD